MISRTYDIIVQWYQSTSHKFSCIISEISSMISYMISRCVYPPWPLKTRLVERCRSRALPVQVQVQDVQNWWRWSSALLDEARLVLGVRHIQTCDVRHRVSQSVIVLGPWAPHQARPVFHGTGGRAGVAAPAPPAPAQGCSSGSWTFSLQELTCQMGIPTGFSDITILTTAGIQQYIHSWCSNWLWVKMWNREHRCNYLQFSRIEEFEELLPAWMQLFWSTVVFIIDSYSSFHHWFVKFLFEIACQPSTVIRVEEVRGRGAPTSR